MPSELEGFSGRSLELSALWHPACSGLVHLSTYGDITFLDASFNRYLVSGDVPEFSRQLLPFTALSLWNAPLSTARIYLPTLVQDHLSLQILGGHPPSPFPHYLKAGSFPYYLHVCERARRGELQPCLRFYALLHPGPSRSTTSSCGAMQRQPRYHGRISIRSPHSTAERAGRTKDQLTSCNVRAVRRVSPAAPRPKRLSSRRARLRFRSAEERPCGTSCTGPRSPTMSLPAHSSRRGAKLRPNSPDAQVGFATSLATSAVS